MVAVPIDGERAMPIYMWTKEGAILITKAARYVVPAVLAAGGAVFGFLLGRRRKDEKRMKRMDGDQGPTTGSC